MTLNAWPDKIYRRPMTNIYFREDGSVFAQVPNFSITYYRYSHTAFDEHGEVDVWVLKESMKPRPPVEQ